eukprot:gnl/Dysnectes_brevis/4716_a6465_493.p1 GENE.gnl/Dysnectes_brevis/4716_a6465_493~~gnl/Dysnectes_brevis/4716_a6465_493.p1  ORF type:complete len:507 (+),score=22.46 gnl/Dysnectes_brevis/4716_a6465_493:230-1522(+)
MTSPEISISETTQSTFSESASDFQGHDQIDNIIFVDQSESDDLDDIIPHSQQSGDLSTAHDQQHRLKAIEDNLSVFPSIDQHLDSDLESIDSINSFSTIDPTEEDNVSHESIPPISQTVSSFGSTFFLTSCITQPDICQTTPTQQHVTQAQVHTARTQSSSLLQPPPVVGPTTSTPSSQSRTHRASSERSVWLPPPLQAQTRWKSSLLSSPTLRPSTSLIRSRKRSPGTRMSHSQSGSRNRGLSRTQTTPANIGIRSPVTLVNSHEAPPTVTTTKTLSHHSSLPLLRSGHASISTTPVMKSTQPTPRASISSRMSSARTSFSQTTQSQPQSPKPQPLSSQPKLLAPRSPPPSRTVTRSKTGSLSSPALIREKRVGLARLLASSAYKKRFYHLGSRPVFRARLDHRPIHEGPLEIQYRSRTGSRRRHHRNR